jgi:asparagine synthase (glutamine-hydrolysing)
VALNGDGGDEAFAGYERYAAMRLAQTYNRIPAVLRDRVMRQAIELIPSSETRRGRVRDVKRFINSASLPNVERYLGWVSVFNSAAKQDLYSEKFCGKPRVSLRQACSSRGLPAQMDPALSMRRCLRTS